MTKWQLFIAFAMRSNDVGFVSSGGKGYIGVIASIQHEDGSGHSFNITLEDGRTFHMRTID